MDRNGLDRSHGLERDPIHVMEWICTVDVGWNYDSEKAFGPTFFDYPGHRSQIEP